MSKRMLIFTGFIALIIMAIATIMHLNAKEPSLPISQYLPKDVDVDKQQEIQKKVDEIVSDDHDFSSIVPTLDDLRNMYSAKIIDYKLCEYIVLEKFRNGSIKFTGNPNFSEYHTIIGESYVVYLVEHNTDKKSDTSQWEYNLEFLTSNYDSILEEHKPNKLLKFYIDDYIEVYSNMLKNKKS